MFKGRLRLIRPTLQLFTFVHTSLSLARLTRLSMSSHTHYSHTSHLASPGGGCGVATHHRARDASTTA
eukprot:scaffold98814_cov73-Phaeocystis_antarctica.AAC.5